MKFNVTCPRCHGTGKNISTCPACHGEGSVERTDPLEVRIKAGTRDGQRIRIAGKGNAGCAAAGWAIFTSLFGLASIRFFGVRAMTFTLRSGDGGRSGAGVEDRGADD